jgi:hypothetical protein
MIFDASKKKNIIYLFPEEENMTMSSIPPCSAFTSPTSQNM